MFLLGGVFFIVEVVEKTCHAPQLLVLLELAGIGAHAGLNAPGMGTKAGALGPLE
jgi:hypothetical protein